MITNDSNSILEALATSLAKDGAHVGTIGTIEKTPAVFSRLGDSSVGGEALASLKQKQYVVEGRKESGVYVAIAELKDYLAKLLGYDSDLAFWRLAALVCLHSDHPSETRTRLARLVAEGPVQIDSDLILEVLGVSWTRDSWSKVALEPPGQPKWAETVALVQMACCKPDAMPLSSRLPVLSLVRRASLAVLASDAGMDEKTLSHAILSADFQLIARALADFCLRQCSSLRNLRRERHVGNGWNHELGSEWLGTTSIDQQQRPAFGWVCGFLVRKLHGYESLQEDGFSRKPVGQLEIPANSSPEQVSLMRMVEHLDLLKGASYGVERSSHVMRAKENARGAGLLLAPFVQAILQAFGNEREDDLVEILSFAMTEGLVERLRSVADGPDRLSKSGAIADTILRRVGVIASTEEQEAHLRHLIGPTEPIRGQTWLNDLGLEHLLYEAARTGETKFADSYSETHNEREEELLRDLFDDFLKPELEKAVVAANSRRTGGQRWMLRWSHFSKESEELIHGADLALEVVVSVQGQRKFTKCCFIQVKRMKATKGRFASSWWLDAKQRQDLEFTFGPSAFYLLLTPSVVSPSQRVLPVDMASGILEATGRVGVIGDSLVGPCSHSLAHFLVYDVLAGWQGDSSKRMLADPITGLPREGRRSRYLLRIELAYGG